MMAKMSGRTGGLEKSTQTSPLLRWPHWRLLLALALPATKSNFPQLVIASFEFSSHCSLVRVIPSLLSPRLDWMFELSLQQANSAPPSCTWYGPLCTHVRVEQPKTNTHTNTFAGPARTVRNYLKDRTRRKVRSSREETTNWPVKCSSCNRLPLDEFIVCVRFSFVRSLQVATTKIRFAGPPLPMNERTNWVQRGLTHTFVQANKCKNEPLKRLAKYCLLWFVWPILV